MDKADFEFLKPKCFWSRRYHSYNENAGTFQRFFPEVVAFPNKILTIGSPFLMWILLYSLDSFIHSYWDKKMS